MLTLNTPVHFRLRRKQRPPFRCGATSAGEQALRLRWCRATRTKSFANVPTADTWRLRRAALPSGLELREAHRLNGTQRRRLYWRRHRTRNAALPDTHLPVYLCLRSEDVQTRVRVTTETTACWASLCFI
jgi:hypothetical protein